MLVVISLKISLIYKLSYKLKGIWTRSIKNIKVRYLIILVVLLTEKYQLGRIAIRIQIGQI